MHQLLLLNCLFHQNSRRNSSRSYKIQIKPGYQQLCPPSSPSPISVHPSHNGGAMIALVLTRNHVSGLSSRRVLSLRYTLFTPSLSFETSLRSLLNHLVLSIHRLFSLMSSRVDHSLALSLARTRHTILEQSFLTYKGSRFVVSYKPGLTVWPSWNAFSRGTTIVIFPHLSRFRTVLFDFSQSFILFIRCCILYCYAITINSIWCYMYATLTWEAGVQLRVISQWR